MAETGFHVTLIVYVLAMLRAFFKDSQDVYAGGNMFVYFEEGDPTRKVSPDVFVAFGVPRHERKSWFTWKEGKGLDVVFEFTSKSTQSEDKGWKKGLYEWLGVKEYFLFDPTAEYLEPQLQGYRLVEGSYQPIPIMEGRLQSETLGLTIGAEGQMVTLVITATGERLLPPEEALTARREAESRMMTEAEARQKAEAEVERLRAELERLKEQLKA